MKIQEGKQAAYDDWKAKNTDGYGAGIFRFAEGWAFLMEGAIDRGEKLEDVAEGLSHTADTEGITGFMYGAAVSILSQMWEHGEALRRWHNLSTQLRDEGEKANRGGGVLNPAVVCMG